MAPAELRKNRVSLVEIVIALVLFGLMAALAVPNFTQASEPSRDESLRRSLAVLRIAIEMYYDDHDAYPGRREAGGGYGQGGSAAAFVNQLNKYTNPQGRVCQTRSGEFCYGPYLRAVPRCAISANDASAAVHVVRGTDGPTYTPGVDAGWVYNCDSGYIVANSNEKDAQGVPYSEY
jgi:type II secretory pathway pseudopilin PulG